MTDHDVVVQLNLKSLRSCFQFARHLDVGPGRLGIAGRMIMDLMCPAPLCGQAQHSRCFPRLFGARSHITGSGYSERRGGAETGRVIVVLTAARLTVGTRGAKSAFTTS
jgi:hypothetical protein